MIKKFIAMVIFLYIFFPVVSWLNDDMTGYPPLKNVHYSGKPGDNIKLDFCSEVRFVSEPDTYHYTYTFRNGGTKNIKFTLADNDVLISPLFYFLQDFSVAVGVGGVLIVEFDATTTPLTISAPNMMMSWSSQKNKWFSQGAGRDVLYVPRWNAEIKESVVKISNKRR